MISVGWRGLNGEPARFNEAERCGRAGEFTPLPAQRHRRYGKWKFNLQIDPRPNRSARQYVQQALIRADFHSFVYIKTASPFYFYFSPYENSESVSSPSLSLPLSLPRFSGERVTRSRSYSPLRYQSKRNFSKPSKPRGKLR